MELAGVVVNWDAIGAVGQWVGAGATFTAALVALKLGRDAGTTRVTVDAHLGFPFVPGLGVGEAAIIITAMNKGQRPVNLVATGIGFPGGDRQFFDFSASTMPPLPTILRDGESITWSVRPERLAETMRKNGLNGKTKLHPFYRDVAGKIYAASWKFDSSKWLGR